MTAYDVIVVGAGIAGLVAAIRLQAAGLRTLVIERERRAGGLCGTFELEGHEFVLACNDFGTGLVRELGELGVEIAFDHPRARFHFAAARIQLPPDLATVTQLVRRLPAVVRLFRAGKRVETLGELIDGHVRNPLLADLACLPAFAMMRSPDDVSIRMIADITSKELGYGYDRSCVPIGGPGVLAQRLVDRFEALGGQLRLGIDFLDSAHSDGLHRARTSHGDLVSGALLSSLGRLDEYPDASRPGLECAAYLVVLRSTLPFPAGVHTLDWLGPGLAAMLRRLDAGEPDDAPSLHLFRSQLPPRPGQFTANVFLPVARGERDLSARRRTALQRHVRRRLERLLPGFGEALQFEALLSPAEYEAHTHVRPAPSPLVAPIGHRKPPSYDPRRDIHFIGTSVGPPGEHAGAAALSGRRAALAVLARDCPRATTTRDAVANA